MSGARRLIIGGAGLAGLTVVAAAVSYPWLFRRACLTWGAGPEEVTGELPGDDLLAKPDIVTTRAISISAPPSAVWPWLVQMGSGRGGVYTYDWIENIFGLGMHSADAILPQFQDLKQGDELPLGPGRPVMRVEIFEPERALTVRFEDGNWVWIFALLPDGDRTRLVSRNRIALPGARPPTRLFYMLVMEPGSLVMERRMLLGIKERAERLAGQRTNAEAPGPSGSAAPASTDPALG
jgi:hypothetical protein